MAEAAGAVRKRCVLAATGCAGGLVMLDQTVVVVALGPMARSLGLTTFVMHGVVLVYVLALCAFAPVGGMAARRFGLMSTFRFGVVLFAAASAACGFVPAGDWAGAVLLSARALQGVGAGLMLPVATTVITGVYAEHERGRALAAYAGLAQVFFALGPVVGAVLTQYLGWRSVFPVNLPVAALALWLAARARVAERPEGTPLSAAQPLVVVASVALFVLGLYQCGVGSPADPRTLAVPAAGALALALAVRLVLRSPRPLVDLRLLRIGPYAVATALTALVQAPQLIVMVHGTLYLRQAMHLPPLATGLALLPLVGSLTAGTYLSGHLLDRFRSIRVPVLLGLAAATAGAVLWTAALPSREYLWQVPAMALAGLGMGMPVPALSAELMRAVPEGKRADASVLRQTLRQLGGAVGLAVAGALVLAANDDSADGAGVVTAAAAPLAFVTASGFLCAALLLAAAGLPRRAGGRISAADSGHSASG
ncbi:MFS transporter [Streptomyces lavendulae]|uniref:MFS transporter n=1 Tax=Streptomyces lavendulae TaxID=1914 RepID=UPI0024A05F34|nr:MFS transporter [Streptomyces lavendulae]GLX21454.1 MFS transporter [Streptomyces lavendulae subsp. lavendulae]GLX28871.1 MFS transporter [Streptomyces lavendulae subsp. lavendulae]